MRPTWMEGRTRLQRGNKMKIDGRKIESHVLDIPEGKSGKFEIKHDCKHADEVMPLVNARAAIFAGGRIKSIQFPYPTRWHKLLEKGGTWTSDYPIEQYQQIDCVKGFAGTVLVSGLGVGMIPTILAKRNEIEHVMVIELEESVIKLVAPHMPTKVEVIKADIFDYLKETKLTFDYAFHDIWASDGEHTLATVVLPLRELTRKIGIPDGRISCWNEAVMIGQVTSNLLNIGLFPEMRKRMVDEFDKQKDHPFAGMQMMMPVLEWMVKCNPSDVLFQENVLWFGKIVGKKDWRKRWANKVKQAMKSALAR